MSATFDRQMINAIRGLSMDAVEAAASGHPGTPMALAPVGYVLWKRFLRFDPHHAGWPNRDRFVLSAGHASMLLYSLLHLSGVREFEQGNETGREAVSLDDIRRFRQLDTRTPGHPEYGHTTGVETTTGPLGAGCGNSVGMAIAERWLAAHYNRPGFTLFEHHVYVVCGDGDMQEGVSSEAASLAGHLKLSNLCWIYDSNQITIEGATDLAFSEDVAARFEAYGWQVLRVEDANDVEALTDALNAFRATVDRPTLIVVRSVIGFGSPKAGSEKAHGEPLGLDNVRAAKRALGLDEEQSFAVPVGAAEHFHQALRARGGAQRAKWDEMRVRYRVAHPEAAAELDLLLAGSLPAGWAASLPVFAADPKGLATRDSSGRVLNELAGSLPWLIGGAADLSPSTKTRIASENSFGADNHAGRNLHFGIREHAMGAIVNGMALSGLRPFGATFLVFADYMRPPIRLAALMELGVIWILTHDSIGVGEDGPTHQPVEQLATLRAVPGLDTIRPGDANEAAWAWRAAIENARKPTALILSRQALPTLDRSRYASAEGLLKGGYVLADCAGPPDLILIATGSELAPVVAAYERLSANGIRTRVVSLPSWHRFEQQDDAYRESVLPCAVTARLAVEQAGPFGWDRYVGHGGKTITLAGFGASAPIAQLQEKYGFTVDNIVATARTLVSGR